MSDTSHCKEQQKQEDVVRRKGMKEEEAGRRS
jgi:hypothetical protein